MTTKTKWLNLTSSDPRKADAVDRLRTAAGATGPARVTLCKVSRDGTLARGRVHPAHGATGGVWTVCLTGPERGELLDDAPEGADAPEPRKPRRKRCGWCGALSHETRWAFNEAAGRHLMLCPTCRREAPEAVEAPAPAAPEVVEAPAPVLAEPEPEPEPTFARCGGDRCGCCPPSCGCEAAGESPLRCAEHARPTCYACDAPATGERDRTREAEGRVVPACDRHREPPALAHRWHNVQLRILAVEDLSPDEVAREVERAVRELVAPGRYLVDVAGPLVAAGELVGETRTVEHVATLRMREWDVVERGGRSGVFLELTPLAACLAAAQAWRVSHTSLRAVARGGAA